MTLTGAEWAWFKARGGQCRKLANGKYRAWLPRVVPVESESYIAAIRGAIGWVRAK